MSPSAPPSVSFLPGDDDDLVLEDWMELDEEETELELLDPDE